MERIRDRVRTKNNEKDTKNEGKSLCRREGNVKERDEEVKSN